MKIDKDALLSHFEPFLATRSELDRIKWERFIAMESEVDSSNFEYSAQIIQILIDFMEGKIDAK